MHRIPRTKASVLLPLSALVFLLAPLLTGCKSPTAANQEASSSQPSGVTLSPKPSSTPHQAPAESNSGSPEGKSSGSNSVKIPLRRGLTVVTAIAHPDVGDYESIKEVRNATADAVQISYSSDMPTSNSPGKGGSAPNTKRQSCLRTVLRVDLQTGHEYRENFCQSPDESYPGTTAISISAQTLSDLKTNGQAAFKYQQTETKGPPNETCLLMRDEPADVGVPVLINDRRVQLPAVHAACTSKEDQEDAEFYFLDDPENPLVLAWKLGDTNKLQVVKISFPTDAPRIEQQLQQSGRAEVYGIYFDFGSATIRPESEPVLKQIADILEKNPAWKLQVEGHTDNVGGDAFNMDLSRRRADAVKQSLVERYRVRPDRLSSAGFGATRPKESNDTLEGRARNRRVELVR